MSDLEPTRFYLQSLLAGSPPNPARASCNGYEVVVQRLEAEATAQGRMARLIQLEKTGKFPLLKELLAEDKHESAPQAATTKEPNAVPPLPEAALAQQALAHEASPTL